MSIILSRSHFSFYHTISYPIMPSCCPYSVEKSSAHLCLCIYSLATITLHPLSKFITVSLTSPHISAFATFKLQSSALFESSSLNHLFLHTYDRTAVSFKLLVAIVILVENVLALHVLCFVLVITSRFFLLSFNLVFSSVLCFCLRFSYFSFLLYPASS